MPESESPAVRVMFVCLGNICRSPVAHGLFRDAVRRQGLEDRFEIASSGTGAWHVGQPPDRRMRATARRRGVSIEDVRAQQFHARDLAGCDHVLVMDRANLRAVRRLDTDGRHANKVRLLRDYDPEPGDRQVPDPYYRGGFDAVFDMVKRSVGGLLRELTALHGLPEEPRDRTLQRR